MEGIILVVYLIIMVANWYSNKLGYYQKFAVKSVLTRISIGFFAVGLIVAVASISMSYEEIMDHDVSYRLERVQSNLVKGGKELVEETLACQNILENAAQDDPGQEIGKVDAGLHKTLQAAGPYFIQQQCRHNGSQRGHDDLADGDAQGIENDLLDIRHFHHASEMQQTHPFRMDKAFGGVVVLERHHQTEHRTVIVDKRQDDRNEDHQIKR